MPCIDTQYCKNICLIQILIAIFFSSPGTVIAVIQTISEFEKEIELLQTQKIDVEKHVQSQKREMRGNRNESLSPWSAG